jgi:MFS family permease
VKTFNHQHFIGLSSFEILAMFRRGLFYSYLTIYLRHFLGLSVTATTLFATLPMLVNILSQTLIWGRISDRFQLRRTLIVAGEAMAALGTVGVWYLHRLTDSPVTAGYIIILGLTLVELFWSMSNISWSALISDLYDRSERGRIQGRLTSMGGIGRMAGVWIGGFLYEGLDREFAGWGFHQGTLFFVAAGVMLLSVGPLYLLPEGGISSRPKEDPTQISTTPDQHHSTTKLFVVFLVGMTLINFGRNAIAIIFPQYLTLTSGLGLDSRTLSHILNIQSGAIICLGWAVGWLGRRLGSHRALLAGTLSAIVALMLIFLTTSLPLLYLASFLRGVGDAVIMATAYELASGLIPPAVRARRFAWFNATFFLSWGLPGTLFVGPLVDLLIASGTAQPWAYQVSFAAAAGMTAVGLFIQLALLFFKRPVLNTPHQTSGWS